MDMFQLCIFSREIITPFQQIMTSVKFVGFPMQRHIYFFEITLLILWNIYIMELTHLTKKVR